MLEHLEILEKSGRTPSIDVDFFTKEQSEIDLVKTIGLFNLQVRDAANNLSPKAFVIVMIWQLPSTLFMKNQRYLIWENEKLENSRLCLVNSFQNYYRKSTGTFGNFCS